MPFLIEPVVLNHFTSELTEQFNFCHAHWIPSIVVSTRLT